MLLRLLKLAKQAIKNLVDAWSVTAQKRICRADCLKLGQRSAELGLAHCALPGENCPHSPQLKVECRGRRLSSALGKVLGKVGSAAGEAALANI
jgi:hypothetical protein